METKAHHALVGFFVAFLVAGGAIFALWLSSVTFDREFREFDVVFEGPVRGLRNASEVRFNGIQVGEVTDLGLNPDNPGEVIARIRVDAATPVKVDSVAQLEPQGLTGLSYIQLSSGSPEAARLESRPGDRAPRIYARAAQIEALVEGGETLLESAQLTFSRVGRLLNDENQESVTNTLNNIETLTGRLAADEDLVEEFRAALANLNKAAADVSVAAQEIEQFGATAEAFLLNEVGPMVEDVSSASIEVDRASRETYDALVDVRPALEEFADDGLGELTAAARDLRSLVAALERIALELEQDPAGFVSQPSGEEVEVPR
ncbi:ABC transporter substrate-binding protein [Leptolyngbya valderiana BDU 20041]|nr:ABC transporter substrate-binding protein [Leptolyngbya valderiana BDU 20041]